VGSGKNDQNKPNKGQQQNCPSPEEWEKAQKEIAYFKAQVVHDKSSQNKEDFAQR